MYTALAKSQMNWKTDLFSFSHCYYETLNKCKERKGGIGSLFEGTLLTTWNSQQHELEVAGAIVPSQEAEGSMLVLNLISSIWNPCLQNGGYRHLNWVFLLQLNLSKNNLIGTAGGMFPL